MVSASIPSFGERIRGCQYVPRPSAYLVVRDVAERVAAVRTPLGIFLPGGGIAPGESPREAAEREAREECGFLVHVSGEIGVADQHLYAARDRKHFTKRSWFFRAMQTGSVSASESDHRTVWLAAASAGDAMSHASHAWAIAHDGEARVSTGAAAAAGAARGVRVVPYDIQWPHVFAEERDRLAGVLGTGAAAVHHIGSTSVPGLCAKPVIDVLIETPDLGVIDRLTPRMEILGYVAKGEYGIPRRRYFSRPEGERPKVHVHVYASGDGQIGRHLRFRDYLRAHPDSAKRYCIVKQALAVEHGDNAEAYQSGKADYIDRVDVDAARWAAGREAGTPSQARAGDAR